VEEGQNETARILHSQHGIPASQRNGRSEILIVLERALEDTCPWRGQRHPPTIERMHRDSSKPTESAGIRSRTRARQGPKRDFTFRETLLTDGRFHVRSRPQQVHTQVRPREKAPALLTENHKTQSRYENYINDCYVYPVCRVDRENFRRVRHRTAIEETSIILSNSTLYTTHDAHTRTYIHTTHRHTYIHTYTHAQQNLKPSQDHFVIFRKIYTALRDAPHRW